MGTITHSPSFKHQREEKNGRSLLADASIRKISSGDRYAMGETMGSRTTFVVGKGNITSGSLMAALSSLSLKTKDHWDGT